ncbi:hypothetical protein DFQ27_007726, partial [Actinomortierella ambigua]
KNDDNEDGTGFGSQSIVSQHRLYRRPPPLNIPLVPDSSTSTASPLSPSWWTTASTPSIEASPKQDGVFSTAPPPLNCQCHHRTVEKEGCHCGIRQEEATAQTSIRHQEWSGISSSLHKPAATTTTTNKNNSNNGSTWALRAPPVEKPEKFGEPAPNSSDIEPGGGRRRSAGDAVWKKKSPQPSPIHSKDESLASPSGHSSNQRRLLQQKHQYNQYLLGHPDFYFSIPLFNGTNDSDYERGGGGGREPQESKNMGKNAGDKGATPGGRGGRRKGGARGFRRQRRWRAMQRWSMVISLVVVLAAGTVFVMYIVAHHRLIKEDSEQPFSLEPHTGTAATATEPVQHEDQLKSVDASERAPPAATALLRSQEEVYAQDPQQERVDRLLYRGGGDRWVVDRSASSALTASLVRQLQQQQQQQRQRQLQQQITRASSRKSGTEPDDALARQQSNTANLLDFNPDDDDEDSL